MDPAFTVRVHPSGVVFTVMRGETVMAAATRAGIRWPTICGGLAQCGLCHVEVLRGGALAQPAPNEASMLQRMVWRPLQGGTMRLACQLVIECDLEVFRVGIREPRS